MFSARFEFEILRSVHLLESNDDFTVWSLISIFESKSKTENDEN